MILKVYWRIFVGELAIGLKLSAVGFGLSAFFNLPTYQPQGGPVTNLPTYKHV